MLPEKHAAAFEKYYAMLAERNEKFNLTAIKGRDETYVKHFEDSVAAAPYIPVGSTFCDVGSGAGFPGVPLKIIRPDLDVTLFDALNKRVTFLNELTAALSLSGIRAIHARVEDAARAGNFRAAFDCAAARAVAPLGTLCEYALPLVKTGGIFIAFKSANYADELRGAERAVKILGGGQTEVKNYTLKLNGEKIERILIIIRKIAPSPRGLPRPGNKAKTNPL